MRIAWLSVTQNRHELNLEALRNGRTLFENAKVCIRLKSVDNVNNFHFYWVNSPVD
jgi:hypothetical protein